MTLLVIDVGTSGARVLALSDDGRVVADRAAPLPPDSPAPGLVEFDAVHLYTTVLDVARHVLETGGSVEAVGITDQRASTVVWHADTGLPVGPALGWQDVRTVGRCLELQGQGLRLAPNGTATKAEWLLDQHDPTRSQDLLVGTVDTWLIWNLTHGDAFVTDPSNASATGLVEPGGLAWNETICETLRIDLAQLPAIVPSSGRVGDAVALPGAPPVCGIAGDQQASLLGQGCVHVGDAKVTFGTGGMLDVNRGTTPPPAPAHGTFPLVAWHVDDETTFLTEAVMLAAGTSVAWLVDGIGVVDSLDDVDPIAASVPDTEGVVFVPAMQGIGTPSWDHGARGALFGAHRGTTRAHIVRAVLEGVAARAADLVDAAEADAGVSIDVLRIDGGMTASEVFVQAVADATGRPVEVSPHRETTGIGAGYLAGLACGVWPDVVSLGDLWSPLRSVEPQRATDRDRWLDARRRAERWIPELSGLSF